MALTQVAPGLLDTTAQYYSFKNRIINGSMAIWQRGTSNTTTGGYTADRWTQVSGNSIAHTQSTDAPTGFKYSMQMVGTGSNINQRIESLNCQDLGGATVTISFWYKNVSGSDNLQLQFWCCNSADNFGALTQIGSTQTVASPSSSWTYYSFTFAGISANAVNGLSVYVIRGATASSTGLLTGVQLEKGSTATSFDYRPYGTELALCQRYYWKLKQSDTSNQYTFGCGAVASSKDTFFIVNNPVQMRSAPTATQSGTVNVNYNASAYAKTSIGGQYAGTITTRITWNDASLVAGGATWFDFASGAYIDFSSEL